MRGFFPTLLALLMTAACAREQGAEQAKSPDIILVTIDTLRADALGYAGNSKVRTPFLDGIARQAATFTNAHAHNVVTLPSHVNILTGLYPYQHGIRDNAGFTLDAKFQTVAPLLKAKGYVTAAFVGAFPLDARYGLTPGFDLYDDRYPEGTGKLDFKVSERRADEVLAPAMQWWNAQSGKRFLWVHLYDPHAPYAAPAEFASQYPSDPYLAEVAYVDAALERHLGPVLKSERRPMLIVTADHGEALGDHGEQTHGLFAYEATLKVPLLVFDPAAANGLTESRPVRHIDIAPTILERAGVAVPADRPGISLLASGKDDRPSYFEALSASINRGWAPLVGVVDEGHKYIDLPLPELYDLHTDPAERDNVFQQRRRIAAQLRKILADAAPAPATPRNVTPEQNAQLLSLGYLSGTAGAKKNYTAADDPKNLVDIDNLMHRMVAAYQLGRRDQAVKLARELVQKQPDMAMGREMLAFMLQQTEETDAGIETLRESIARGSATESMKIRLGLMLSESGQAKEAVDILAPFSDKNDVEVLNAYGIALADLQRPADAVRQFERVLKVDPTNAIAWQNLGIVALRTGNVSLAEQHLNHALQQDAQLPLALNTLGVVYAQTGRDAAAIDAWTRAVAADPQLYDALFNLALVAGRNRQWDVARDALTRFIERAPRSRYARDLTTARAMLAEVDRRR